MLGKDFGEKEGMDCSIVRGGGVEELSSQVLCGWKAQRRALLQDQCSLVECGPAHQNPSKPQLLKPGVVHGIYWTLPSAPVEEEHVCTGETQRT